MNIIRQSMHVIPSWKSLADEKTLKKGAPNEYVVFATSGYISSPFDPGCFTATATIGQRDENGRLFQNGLHSRHFCPRKFTVTAKGARLQIRVLHSLTAGLNDGTIAPGFVLMKVSSLGDWNDICNLLKVSGGASNA